MWKIFRMSIRPGHAILYNETFNFHTHFLYY